MNDKLKRLRNLNTKMIRPFFNSEILYSLETFLETPQPYVYVYDFCIAKGIELIVDIGCAHGFQSELFLDTPVAYIGVDDGGGRHYRYDWNHQDFLYITARYPEVLLGDFVPVNPEAPPPLAVSILAIGWLHDDRMELLNQIDALSQDFYHCLIHLPEGLPHLFERHFVVEEIVVEPGLKFHYMINKKGHDYYDL